MTMGVAYGNTKCSAPGCESLAKRAGMCGKHYQRIRTNGSLEPKRILRTPRARLLSKIKVDSAGCWIWTDCLHPSGYGQFLLNGKTMQAHRASWMILVGPIPLGMQVNHKCNVRSCINPDHLYLGNQKDNMADMFRAGRQSCRSGESCATAKLNDEQVRAIRLDARSAPKVAREYGVSPSLIRAIRKGRVWRAIS